MHIYMYIQSLSLSSSEFLGWIDRAYYTTASHTDNITLTVLKGGSVILECSPNTTESLQGLTPVWLPQSKATTLLPSGNVLMSNVQQDTNISCVWALHQVERREFHIRVTSGEKEVVLCLCTLIVGPLCKSTYESGHESLMLKLWFCTVGIP